MKKTKIICTLGPASETEETITELYKAGMNVARINFSHGIYSEHEEKIKRVRKVAEKLDAPIAFLLDTKGPEYRIKTFKESPIQLNEGDIFTFTADEVEGDNKKVSVNYKGLPNDLEIGDTILLNDGLLKFKVNEIKGNDIICTVEIGGKLSNRKSMSFPGKTLKQVYLSEQDKKDLLFGIEHDADFVACSFVSCKQDILDVKNFLKANGGESIKLIAKIENQSGVDNLEDILSVCDGVMVARGDLGVEVPFEKLPAIQKNIAYTCNRIGKRFIVATEMLESMIVKSRPTRAEISDVANAVFDGAGAVMLSGETATGKYPVEAVRTMSKIVENSEMEMDYSEYFRDFRYENDEILCSVAHSTCTLAIDVKAKAIIACSMSGRSITEIARFFPKMDLLGVTPDEKVYRQLALCWGVIPAKNTQSESLEEMYDGVYEITKKKLNLKNGDRVVVAGGVIMGKSGYTDTIRVLEYEE